MSLDINAAWLKLLDNKPVPIVLFTADFNYALAQVEPNQKLAVNKQGINNWQTDLETYK